MLLEKNLNIFDYEVRDEGNLRIYSYLGEQSKINELFVIEGIKVDKININEDKLEDYFTNLVGGGTIG